MGGGHDHVEGGVVDGEAAGPGEGIQEVVSSLALGFLVVFLEG
jgi:hypothetical protein